MDRIAQWQARGRTLEVFGHRVFVVDEGPRDAPVVVSLHGYPTSSIDLRQAMPTLTRYHRVIAHDHLGFGLSDKPQRYSYSLVEQAEVALEVWRLLGVRRAHLLAHDYGTSVATELLARRERGGIPVHLGSLALCNGSVHIELAGLRPIQRLLAGPLGPTVANLSTERVFRSNLLATLARKQAFDEEELAAAWTLLTRADGKRRLGVITRYLLERQRLWDRWIGALTRLEMPTLVLWGAEDPVAVPAIAEALAGEIPGARLQWLPGLGHYPMVEGPQEWAESLLAFWGGLTAAPG